MEDYNFYIPLLSEELRNEYFMLIHAPSSSDSRLKANDFVSLSKKMGVRLDELMTEKQKKENGDTLSDSVIEQILKGNYKVTKSPPDARSKHTLNKVAIFLGYQDWVDFVKNKRMKFNSKDQEEIVELIKVVFLKTFECLRGSKRSNINDIEQYYCKNSPALMQLKYILAPKEDNFFTLNSRSNSEFALDDLFNRHTYNLIKVAEYKQHADNYVAVKTDEYYNVPAFVSKSCFRFDLKSCLYLLLKVDGQWKIEDKYSIDIPYGGVDENRIALLKEASRSIDLKDRIEFKF